MIQINESELNRTDRLGLAWCRLNCWEWDDLLGPKPPDFDDLPFVSPTTLIARIRNEAWRKYRRSRQQYVRPARLAIETIIGKANASRCWWMFELGKSEEEWLRWYLVKDLPNYSFESLQ